MTTPNVHPFISIVLDEAEVQVLHFALINLAIDALSNPNTTIPDKISDGLAVLDLSLRLIRASTESQQKGENHTNDHE